MPDLGAHQQQVEHNRQTTTHLQQAGDKYLDWVVTLLFYTSLHLIDQVLYHIAQLNPRNHFQRHAAIANTPELTSIYQDYRELEHQSRRSRYECARFTSEEVERLSDSLARIEQVVKSVVVE
jgi:hypothetical protein